MAQVRSHYVFPDTANARVPLEANIRMHRLFIGVSGWGIQLQYSTQWHSFSCYMRWC